MKSTPAPADATRSATLVVFTAVFIDLVGFGIVLPLLPSYAARFHVSDASIGMLVASFSLMQFVFAPRWGRLSDRIGRRPVLLSGLAGSALSYLLLAIAPSFFVLLLSRLVAGAMGATVSVAQAYLADVTPPERRSRAMGFIGAAFGLGFVVGPAIGGISSQWGHAAPGYVASALCASNFLLAWFRLPETRVHVPFVKPALTSRWKGMAAPYGVMAFSTIAFTVMYVVFPLHIERELGYDRRHAAYFFVLIGLVTAAVQGGLVGRLAPRFGDRKLMLTGCVLLALGLSALPFAYVTGVPVAWRLPALLGALLLLAFGPGLVGPSVTGYVSRISTAEEQGRALGTLTSVGAVARIVGPMMAGTLNGIGGARTAFLASAGAAALAALSALALE